MDLAIIVTLLIMFCVIIVVMLSEMQRLNEESEKLRKELEVVNRQRYIEDERHKELQQILKNRLEELKKQLGNQITEPKQSLHLAERHELRPLHFEYCMSQQETEELKLGKLPIEGVARARLFPKLIYDLSDYVTEEYNERTRRTTYMLDIWVTKY